MRKISLNIPPNSGCQVSGYLYSLPDRSLLGEDMLEVTLPDGTLLSVGWYPEGDENGQYRIDWTAEFKCFYSRCTKDVMAVKTIVEEIVRQVSGNQ